MVLSKNWQGQQGFFSPVPTLHTGNVLISQSPLGVLPLLADGMGHARRWSLSWQEEGEELVWQHICSHSLPRTALAAVRLHSFEFQPSTKLTPTYTTATSFTIRTLFQGNTAAAPWRREQTRNTTWGMASLSTKEQVIWLPTSLGLLTPANYGSRTAVRYIDIETVWSLWKWWTHYENETCIRLQHEIQFQRDQVKTLKIMGFLQL